MKFLSVSISILLLLGSPAARRAEAGDDAQALELTMEVLGERYCAVNAQTDALQLKLRLRYLNKGSRKLILYRGNNLFYQLRVSRAADGTWSRKPELYMTSSRYFDEQPEQLDRAAPGRVFTILSPGSAYETVQPVTVPVRRAGSASLPRVLDAGEYTLQLVVSTWYGSKELAEKLRRLWQRNGLLRTDAVASAPLRFRVEQQRSVVTCQEK